MSPERELARARAALMWERARTLRDARLRANGRFALLAVSLALALAAPTQGMDWLLHLMR